MGCGSGSTWRWATCWQTARLRVSMPATASICARRSEGRTAPFPRGPYQPARSFFARTGLVISQLFDRGGNLSRLPEYSPAPCLDFRGRRNTSPARRMCHANDSSEHPMQAKRIVILGPCGAGKSTLARRIGERLDLPVVHLDTLNWNPGWVQTDVTKFREQVAEAVKGDAWVMDGNYTGSHLDLRLS